MQTLLVILLVVVALVIAVGLYRVWAGPTVFDRLIAVSLVTVNSLVALVLLGYVIGRPEFFLEIAVGYALLVFLFPIAIGRYFERHALGGRTPADDLDGGSS